MSRLNRTGSFDGAAEAEATPNNATIENNRQNAFTAGLSMASSRQGDDV
jgi:hypothetical protein